MDIRKSSAYICFFQEKSGLEDDAIKVSSVSVLIDTTSISIDTISVSPDDPLVSQHAGTETANSGENNKKRKKEKKRKKTKGGP